MIFARVRTWQPMIRKGNMTMYVYHFYASLAGTLEEPHNDIKRYWDIVEVSKRER